MELTYADLSSPGPVRPKNEDSVGFWKIEEDQGKRMRSAMAVLADGVGGLGQGDIASRLAVDTALKTFREAKTSETAQKLLTQVFNTSNVAVYDKGMDKQGRSRMATTLAVVVFQGNQICVGNVGDSRVYVVRRGEIKQITTDHSYIAMQRKLGLVTEEEAKVSEYRSVLTRSVGQEPFIRFDYEEETLLKGDRVVLCSDGLHAFVTDSDICNIVGRCTPAQACRQLVALAEQRGTDDNVSVQVIQVEEVEKVAYFLGSPVYMKQADPSPSGEVRVGDTLDDRFFITEVLSRSGMGTVYKATDKTNKQTVAVKIPHMQFESDPGFFHRFQREEDIGSRLNHPYILKFFTVDQKSRPYIVTEYLRGYTLAHLLHSVRPLPLRDALKIASRLCDALTYMHSQDVVHRDLKPQNIMICNDGTIRVMDFGIAKAGHGRRVTFTGFTPAMGTPDYMAPEQVKGKRGDERTDLYSLGAMLYEMLTGHTPFEDENPLVVMNLRVSGDPPAPRELNAEIPPQVEEIILHAMERDPHHRYRTAAELKADLEAPDKVEVTGRAQRLQSPKKWKSGSKMIRIIGLSLLIPALLVLLFMFLVWQTPHHR